MNAPLDPCPFCGARDLEVQPDGRVHCRACDAWGPAARSASAAGWSGRAAAGADAVSLFGLPLRSSERTARLALLLLGFSLAALALLFTQIGELARWRYLGAAGAAALLMLLSLLCGAAHLALAHLEVRPLSRWRGLLFLVQTALATLAAVPMAFAFFLD
ncbi:MAG TPA: hypothetical protein VF121_12950 [Thermoanaerobaculia bacterium]|nr:hypothetical protein [Thermoanaerobaculia bacterium]